MGNGGKKQIKANPPADTSRIQVRESHSVLLRFSFRHVDLSDGDFSITDRDSAYLLKFIERLKSLSGWKTQDVLTSRSSSMRAHPIEWADTTKPNGFTNLNQQLQDERPYQMSVSANEYGRLHGFFLDDTFYVVWFDPDHNLYS